ncbi:MAG: hypothetical protein QXL16_01790, partial [Candidatus Micrarchaeaceae archaeon]
MPSRSRKSESKEMKMVYLLLYVTIALSLISALLSSFNLLALRKIYSSLNGFTNSSFSHKNTSTNSSFGHTLSGIDEPLNST